MNNEILEAIKKALPSMQVDVINNELFKARKYDTLIEQHNDLKNIHSKTLAEKEELYKDKEKIKLTQQQLETKIKEYEDLKQSLEIKMLKHELQCERNSNINLKDLMYAAFRNPTVHKSFSKNVVIPNNSYSNVVSESEYTTQD